jgi:hypothetical protein
MCVVGCSAGVVMVVMWGNCMLGSFLRIWVLLVFDLPMKAVLIILGITLRLCIRGFWYSNFMFCIYTVLVVVVLLCCSSSGCTVPSRCMYRMQPSLHFPEFYLSS